MPVRRAVRGEEELLEIIAPDGDEIHLFKEFLRRESQRRCFQHRAHFQRGGQGVAQDPFALQRLVHLGTGGGIFVILRDEREHHGQRPPVGRTQQRLQLHPHDPRLVQPHPDRPPAQRRVGFVRGLHIGQHLVRSDIQRAKHHPLAMRRIQHPRIQRGQFGACGHLVAHQKLQFGAEQADTFGPRPVQRRQVGHQPGIHMHPDHGTASGFGRLVADRRIAFQRIRLHRDLVAKRRDNAVIGAQMHNTLIAVHHHMIAVQRLGGDFLCMDDQRNSQRPGNDRRVRPDRSFLQHDPFQIAAIIQQFPWPNVARHENRMFGHFRARVAAFPWHEMPDYIMGRLIHSTETPIIFWSIRLTS